jgi:hypothetical protein
MCVENQNKEEWVLGPLSPNEDGVEEKLRRQPVGQSVMVSDAHLGPATNFSFSLKFPLDNCGFVIL